MNELERFGVSIPNDLLAKFDRLIERKGYANRSEAIRDLMREMISEQSISEDKAVVGTVTLVYDHHTHDLTEKLNELQHDHFQDIVSTTHIHLDHHNCLEVLIVKGRSSAVQRIADRLISTKGVKHGKLVMTAKEQ